MCSFEYTNKPFNLKLIKIFINILIRIIFNKVHNDSTSKFITVILSNFQKTRAKDTNDTIRVFRKFERITLLIFMYFHILLI